MHEPTCIDLFAGAGGLSEGLALAGFRTLYANELDPVAASTYALNHPSSWVESGDIRTTDASHVRRALGLQRGQLTLIAGGPPCQGFSINAPERRQDDRRNHLVQEYLRFVEEFLPETILIENVPGLVSFSAGSTLRAILSCLAELGYRTDVKILYAPHYGVPQMRWRTIVLGVRGDIEQGGSLYPQPQYSAPARVNFRSTFDSRSLLQKSPIMSAHTFTSVRSALEDLPAATRVPSAVLQYESGPTTQYQRILREGSTQVSNHVAAQLSTKQKSRLRHIPPGGNWTNIPRDLLPKGMQRARSTDHTKRYGRSDPDGLASTILTKCDPHWGAYYHYAHDRVFTVREAARLQSFPDRFVFLGNRADQYRQVGNAVPPLLAQAVGLALLHTAQPAAGSAYRAG